VVIHTDFIGSCKSNNHTITTTMATPFVLKLVIEYKNQVKGFMHLHCDVKRGWNIGFSNTLYLQYDNYKSYRLWLSLMLIDYYSDGIMQICFIYLMKF